MAASSLNSLERRMKEGGMKGGEMEGGRKEGWREEVVPREEPEEGVLATDVT